MKASLPLEGKKEKRGGNGGEGTAVLYGGEFSAKVGSDRLGLVRFAVGQVAAN